MTRNLRALLVAFVLIVPFVASSPSSAQDGALSQEYVREVICADAYSWDCATAQSVVWRESRNDPNAYNPGCRCVGWWQIAGVHGHTYEALTDPVYNTHVAYELWLASGWAPWRTQ